MLKGRPLQPIPTWKLKHSKEALLRLATDPAMFNRGYRMQAINEGDLKFPSFKKCCIALPTTLGDLHRRRLPAYVGVDLSGNKRPGNAISVVGLEPATRRRIQLEIMFGAWSSPEMADRLADVNLRHNVQFIQVENNAYQQSLIDWVRKSKTENNYWMKIEAFTTGANKANPDYGLPVMEVEFHNQGWIFPYQEWEGHDPSCVCDWCRLDREFSLYPKGASADGVMATWFARDALNKWAPMHAGTSGGVGNLNLR